MLMHALQVGNVKVRTTARPDAWLGSPPSSDRHAPLLGRS